MVNITTASQPNQFSVIRTAIADDQSRESVPIPRQMNVCLMAAKLTSATDVLFPTVTITTHPMIASRYLFLTTAL